MSTRKRNMTAEELEAYKRRRKRRRERRVYDPFAYWHVRGFRYDAPNELKREGIIMASALKRYQCGDDRYLEIGPGDGRVFQYLLDRNILTRNSYSACDISRTMIERCFFKTGLRVKLWDGRVLPYGDGEFEWVLLIHVLLHVPPVDVLQLLLESARVCNRFIYAATYTGPHEPDAKHCFKHDYSKLFKHAGLRTVYKRPIDSQITHFLLGEAR